MVQELEVLQAALGKEPFTPVGFPWDAKLCYVEGGMAFFTTQPLDRQWGDDWNDAPYEHNAGTPYRASAERGESWEIVELFWDGPWVTPRDSTINSEYSVEMINRGAIPWLRPDIWPGEKHTLHPIAAGTTVRDFIQQICDGGGKIWFPLERLEGLRYAEVPAMFRKDPAND